MEVLITGYNKELDEFSITLNPNSSTKSVNVSANNLSEYLKTYFSENSVKPNQKESNIHSRLQRAGFTNIESTLDKHGVYRLTAIKEIQKNFKIHISYDSESKEWRVQEAAIFFSTLDRLLEYVEDTQRLMRDCRPLVTVSFPTLLPRVTGNSF